MPRLHKNRERNTCYVLTAIGGSVITYQLTPEGEKKLTAAGIAGGQTFARALLLDLYRTGDAFTRGSGVEDPALANHLAMDFANDPDPETAFPACDICRSVNDLHLTITGNQDVHFAQLQCAACRATLGAQLETSIPVGLLARPGLSRLFQLKSVAQKSKCVTQFEELLRAEFESKWEALRKQCATAQRNPRTAARW